MMQWTNSSTIISLKEYNKMGQIEYRGNDYPIRSISGFLIGSPALYSKISRETTGFTKMDPESNSVDENIYYYCQEESEFNKPISYFRDVINNEYEDFIE